jgi:glycosyltransferase involved in cell wall biosynthesis
MTTNEPKKSMKALTLLTTGVLRANLEDEAADKSPRASLYERSIETDMLDDKALESAPAIRRWCYSYIPKNVAQVIEAYCIRKRYDVIISWSDPHALMFAALLKLTRSKIPHVALMFWISKPKKAAVLKRVHSHINKIVLWTSSHREFAINVLGISPSKIKFIPYYVDEKFWRPMEQETDMIASVGIEMRDYPTLIKALNGLDIKCHLAAGSARGKLFDTVRAIYEQGPLSPNITVGKLEPTELRALYARSRFVVVPLLPSDSDNGLTVILEAMAMGKAVICSRTSGQRDVIQEGKTGIFVPQGNADALREAIQYLWNHPEIAEQMGREGRKHIEANNGWEQFIASVKSVAEEAVHDTQHQQANNTQRTLARIHATGAPISS